ncbi:DUF2996 domain-containing protein [Spirulina subsalsa]|uniref:DUF2996 domain-containing protein n=1 Tax=Spirulina subsalsa TaxID=54311 RepID=UPI0002F819D3|nr:DUF2996 domain-containing protein [Spirulina subsalsa]
MAEETEKAAAKKPPKKEKPPAVEDKPFGEFMEQHFTPALQAAFAKEGIEDVELAFENKPLPKSFGVQESCWQVEGRWQKGDRQFNLYYFDESITGAKGFSSSTYGKPPSTLESFMIDERKVTLDLMVLYTLQRLNGEKWVGRN